MTTYLTDSDGKFIPATQRPDGTWRKARRVKEGYVPQEEVPLYESKGKKFSEQRTGNYPPGFSPNGIDQLKKERQELLKAKTKKAEVGALLAVEANDLKKTTPTIATTATATRATKSKTKAGKTKTTTTTTATITSTTSTTCNSNTNMHDMCSNLCSTTLNDDDEQQNIAKQLKKLRKKMREIEAIEAKLGSGVLKKPEMDQLMKVKRKADIQKEIERLNLEDLCLIENNISDVEATTTNSIKR